MFIDFDPKELVINLAPEIATRIEIESELRKSLKDRSSGKKG